MDFFISIKFVVKKYIWTRYLLFMDNIIQTGLPKQNETSWDDCTEFILPISRLFMISLKCKLVSFFAQSFNKSFGF